MKTNLSFIAFLSIATLASLPVTNRCAAASTAVGWGDNSHSQTNVPASATNIVSVAGGSFHSLALRSTGRVVGWGDNATGATTPPASLTNAVAIAAGDGFSLALRSNGAVISWGSQTTVPAGLTQVVAIAVAQTNELALTRDGLVISWGAASSPAPAHVTNVVAIAAGNKHSLALMGDGTVVAWGDSALGKTTVPPGLNNVIALAAGAFHSLALKRDGTVVAWGDNTYGQSSVPFGLENVIAIAGGATHSLALKGDGTVVAWGDNTYGQRNAPASLSGVTGIAGGRYHSLAIVGDGSPVITLQPVGQYDAGTGSARFTVTAAGQAPLSYQWLQDGTNIADATNSILEFPNLPISAAGVYSVTVSNSLGSVTSAIVTLPPAWRFPFVISHPPDLSVLCNDPTTFLVDAGGTKPLSYQWLYQGAAIPDATNAVLAFSHTFPDQAGEYAVVISNAFGGITSRTATLSVAGQEPLITSALSASGKQGVAFSYKITALHTPTLFTAAGLPSGLAVNSTNGNIQGTPVESGTFTVLLGTANLCASATTNLTLTITSSIPAITSSLSVAGAEQVAFNYQITASQSPTSFGAVGLPQALSLNPATGRISGTPIFSGSFLVTISASNIWGVGTASLRMTFSNVPVVAGLAITDVTTNYTSPYLLDFKLSLRDSEDPAVSHAVVVDPQLLSVTAFEDDVPVSPSETGVILQSANAALLKAYLVLDFSDSIASIANGDTNNNGISDSVDLMVSSAQSFVNKQQPDAQVGVYEFHRDDAIPQKVIALTSDKTTVNNSIAGIWTNHVRGFSSGSRCWDALGLAIKDYGPTNLSERHYVIFISDGKDESSTNTVNALITAAKNANVQIYCVGFGAEIDAATLQSISSQTLGRYYEATNATDLATQFAQIGKDLSGQYILRWATLKRANKQFIPSFQISYLGFTAASPTNPYYMDTNNPIIDTNAMPPTTNFPLLTNFVISPYNPTLYAGDVTVGSLNFVTDSNALPSTVTLRATYVPRNIRQIRLHYRANWPCTTSLQSTNAGELLEGWSLSETNDGTGGKWALLSSPDPQDVTTSIPFASFGKLLTFAFHDAIYLSNAFSVFEVDNTIYTNTGKQSFKFANSNAVLANYPVLPFGTPVPWLMTHGFSTGFTNAEVSDPDGDGVLTWQEYQAGTDPQKTSSILAISSLATTGPYGRYQITFSSALYRFYRLEASDDFLTWQVLQQDIPGTGGNVTVTDNRNLGVVPHTYYRIAVY